MPDQPLSDNVTSQPTHSFWGWLILTTGETRFDRLLVPILLMIQVVFTGSLLLAGNWRMTATSMFGISLIVLCAGVAPVQRLILRQKFTRSHAFYLTTFWVYSLVWVQVVQALLGFPSSGKESRPFYLFAIFLVAITFRLLLSLFAITPSGYRLFISKLSLPEQLLVAINEFVAAGMLAFIFSGEFVRILQPDVFSLRTNWLYSAGLASMTLLYYLIMQLMWIEHWNDWLGKNKIWVRLARFLAPIALMVASIVILKHFTRLSEPRSANLLGAATIDQTILALSPIIWMMVFFIVVIVFTGGRGVRNRLIPPRLLAHLPDSISDRLQVISDMDILLLVGALMTIIPLELFVFESTAIIGGLQQRLTRENALIDSSEQALALIFALPFYFFAIVLLVLYALVMARSNLSAKDRDALVQRLPITLLIIFIITLYLAAIPFSQVLSSGKVEQNLGFILAFDVLIPLILLYAHYFVLIRIPYARGQSRWRQQYGQKLELDLAEIDRQLANLQSNIESCEMIWKNRAHLGTEQDQYIDMLHDLIQLNGERDHLNMERLRIVRERQELTEVSEAPISLTVARLPARVFRLGIPLVLAFKIYEWAIVNDGLREVANNPNIGVLEFFQTILENTNF